MSSLPKWLVTRGTERIFLLLVAVVMGMLFLKMFSAFQADFNETETRLREGSVINLNGNKQAEKMSALLEKGFYFKDKKDIDLISSVAEREQSTNNNSIDNIGELNKRKYSIKADEAFARGGEVFKNRARLARNLVGFTDLDSNLYIQETNNPLPLTSSIKAGAGKHSINGIVQVAKDKPVAGVLVRLNMVLPPDSLQGDKEEEIPQQTVEYYNGIRKVFVVDDNRHKKLELFTAFARTDATGRFTFSGLPADTAFEVLPLQPGYQFGASQGITNLEKDITLTFRQLPHTIKLLSTGDFATLKKEKALIVRTPQEATNWFLIIVASFFFSFLVLHVFLSIRFPNTDELILPILMLLTGLSFITLLSLKDPLRDRFLAKSTLTFFGAGIVGILVLLQFNLRKFTTDSWLYRLFIFKWNKLAANGWPWAFAAMGLLALTIFFGTGPEGSGVRVNLFGFQPSEIVKFLVVVFLAGFFSANEKFISEYTSLQKRSSFFFFALVAIGITILLFLILGDLGPAMVCCFTFIILFSFSRGDFAPMTASVILFVLSIWLTKNVWLGTGITIVLMLAYMLFKKKSLSESALMVLVVIGGFLLLDQVPYLSKLFPGPIQRLVDRKAIWQDPWNNEVFGGDQVANGIWAMAGGGTTGQGTGEGFAKTIPEAHTDMILPSIGEEFGWAGIICIFVLFVLYLHRSIIIGRKTGAPFLFYVCAGIGIGTFVQFLLIAGGSTGALPLSGVALPFVSYGGSSLLCNMIAAGFLLSASHLEGSPAQMKYITKQQDRNLLPALAAAFAGIILLGVNVSKYHFDNKQWVVKPALIADRSGARMFSYNPRISILMNRLQAGNLLDRKGRLLATSHPELIKQQEDSLVAQGIRREDIDALAYKRQSRYYPYAEQMFFWTGDANTGVFGGSPNGYFAEYEHAADLRGFPAPTTQVPVRATRFKQDKFLERDTTEMMVNKKDYSALSSLLIAGINSKETEAFKQRNRDVKLSMDAALQTALQRSMEADDSVKIKRVSVVIMEDSTGDILASAMYPLPPVNDWERLTMTDREMNKLPGWNVNSDIGFTRASQPGSTAKLVTALSAFNKYGEAIAKKTILVHGWDLIRTKGYEPDEAGDINIERGIVKSNNPFFIRLANEMQLQEEMGTLYIQSGMYLHGVGGYYFQGGQPAIEQQNTWRELWRRTEFKSIKRYDPNNIKKTRNIGVSAMAWGQGELIATPASVARIASAIANHGILMPNRFVVSISGTATALQPGIAIAKSPRYAELMTEYMRKQSAPKVGKLGINVAGKTGTPERIWKGEQINDGWYVFFAPKPNGGGHVVTCIRVEKAKGSSEAVALAGKHVIPLLLKMGYIKSFEPVKQ